MGFIVALTAIPLFSDTATIDGIMWNYQVNDGEAEIFGGYGVSAIPKDTSGSITIPSSLGGCPVTSIGFSAFFNCYGLTSVTIPNSVTSIGDSAFSYCYGLTSVTIGNSVTSIGYGAFAWCDGLTSVTIGNSVTSIGSHAFYSCSGLTSVTIPNSVTRIGDYAFAWCDNLKSAIFLGDAPRDVGSDIFDNCADDFTIKVKKGTKGWNGDYNSTALPATWQGYPIEYATESDLNLTYKVVFNANGGSGTMAAQTIACNTWTKLRANAFKRSGYTFLGWAKSATGAVVYKNAAAVKNLRSTAGTVTLYARWAKTKYKIAFYANGGTGSMSAQSMTYNKAAYLKKNAFKRTGYTFVGWAKSVALAKKGKVAYKNRQAVKNLLKKSGTVKLIAVWKPVTYKVAFYANGGIGKTVTQTMTYNRAAYLKKNAFKRTGYTFLGWAKKKNGAVAYKNAVAVKNLLSAKGTIKLYAVWAKTKYKVAFYANGGSGSMSAQAMTYNKAAYLKKNAFKRTGYTFAGWAKSVNGSVVYKDGKAVKNLTTTGATIKLYAVWKPITYNVAFYPNGGTGSGVTQSMTYNKTANLRSNTFIRTGYTFKGWAKSPTGSVVYTNGKAVKNLTTNGGTVKLYAVWEQKMGTYMVIDLYGGLTVPKFNVTYMDSVPEGGWTDEYKTTKLVLRKIKAGKMPRTDIDITLTKDYYIGVFEVTQKQWELVMGSNPSYWDNDTLPVEEVSYDDVRGTGKGSQWPASNSVDATSFMGKLRAKTGIDFDLPTEAQWEYACRAGSSGDWGLLADGTMGTLSAMGWWWNDSSDKTHTVGIKTPNAWGLYDMHGNVYEWCLDWYSDSGYSGTDPVGATSGSDRVYRGGYFYDNNFYCRSSTRQSRPPDGGYDCDGLRVAAPAGL